VRALRWAKGSRQTATYRALISIGEEVVAGARKALDDTAAMRAKDPLTALKIETLRDEIAHYCDLGTRVGGINGARPTASEPQNSTPVDR
jgi:hypothetical protein